MTYPPSGPSGQPGPIGPPGGAGPFAQPAPPPQAAAAPPFTPQQPFTPRQAADPWGPPPGAFDGFGGLAGPAAKQPRKRTGPVIGALAATVVVLGGGVTAIVLLTEGGDTGTPAGVAQQAVEALNARDTQRYAALMCAPPKQDDLTNLQQQWARATDLHGAVAGSPQVTGTSATAPVDVTYNGSTQNTTIPMKQQGQKWCIAQS